MPRRSAARPRVLVRLARDTGSRGRIGAHQPVRVALAALLLLTIPLAGTYFARLGPKAEVPPSAKDRPGRFAPPPIAPLAVEPAGVLELSADKARAVNAAIPFSTAPNPASRPFHFGGGTEDRARAVDCLAAAQYYEAGDDAVGQKAVAQVVLNRLRHPAFPKSVCEVVFQGAERETGCQFTFTCDGSLTRIPSLAAWERARALARRMLTGTVERKVGLATHYHTDWVVPYWSASLDKITEVHTHLFFRWPGWWGTPGAFLRRVGAAEPNISLLAHISDIHARGAGTAPALSADGLIAPQMTEGAADLAGSPRLYTPRTEGPRLLGNARLVATSPEGDSFIIALPPRMATSDYVVMARIFCTGRARCRVMGWRSDASPPAGFPIPARRLSTMRFSYIHDAQSGLQRLLWNCDAVPQDDPRNCMRERIPVADLQPAIRPKAP